mmetsp:Transcript_29546/g.45101  ORF Transcript_29546/g.45101 Transcript_29546/m.45101 type:complete len:575 (-) Transcript_29546:24-1748(-)
MAYCVLVILRLLIAGAVVIYVDAFSQTGGGGRLLITRSARSAKSEGRAFSFGMSMVLRSSKIQEKGLNSLEGLTSSASSSVPPLEDSKGAAFPQQTPHSGRHFLPTHPSISQSPSTSSSKMHRIKSKILNNRNPFRRASRRSKHKRFMEGWYYRITLPEEKVSFAFIFSIEDPNPDVENGELSLAAVQVMGPNDEYVVQADKDHSKFWAWEHSQAFGYTFEEEEESSNNVDGNMNIAKARASATSTKNAMTPEEFRSKVKTGFQILPTSLQGRVNGHDGSKGGVLEGQGIPRTCDFDMEITPLSGWGDDNDNQKSTGGWLASYSVFEPHWQVTMADARATGYATWDGKRYEFDNVPFYAEKNWGGSFPSKWYWVQCNSFQDYTGTIKDGDSSSISRLSLTAGGGTRKVPFGRTEDLGMVSVHHNGKFYEAVPWTGEMSWDVEPWGSWSFNAKCTSGERLFEVDVTAKCDEEGVTLRAPTEDLGMAYFCRDSFFANCNLSLYELVWDANQKEYVRGNTIIDNAKSIDKTCAVEIGGGPYWNAWKKKSQMVQPIKALVKLPYLFRNIGKRRRNKKA